MNIKSQRASVALAVGVALVVVVVGAAGAGVALGPADVVASETSSLPARAPLTAPAQHATQPLAEADGDAAEAAPAEAGAAPTGKRSPVEQNEGGEGYEGPGTERLPNTRPAGEGAEYEGPGTERLPNTRPAGDGAEYEGPGADRTFAPVYRTVTASSWRIVVPSATVYAVPGDTKTKSGSISDARADIAGTGRAATVGTADWFEVKVPGASTGWVVGSELERL